MFLILMVLHDTALLNDLLMEWNSAGAPGVTVLPSIGLGRMKKLAGLREDLPLIPSLEDILRPNEESNRTLFAIVETEEMVDRIVAATMKITGDLDLPQTGILAVLPVMRCYGLHRKEGPDNENSYS